TRSWRPPGGRRACAPLVDPRVAREPRRRHGGLAGLRGRRGGLNTSAGRTAAVRARATSFDWHALSVSRTAGAFSEGRAAQLLHLGPYAAERGSIERLHEAIAAAGFMPVGRHHEIYLGDPRRAAPDRLKTILRQAISGTWHPSPPAPAFAGVLPDPRRRYAVASWPRGPPINQKAGHPARP